MGALIFNNVNCVINGLVNDLGTVASNTLL